MDILIIALCLSIGTGVPWLVAIYCVGGDRQLIENSVFSLMGTASGAGAFYWMSPRYGLIALVVLGPVVAYLAIVVGQAAKRAILAKLSPPT